MNDYEIHIVIDGSTVLTHYCCGQDALSTFEREVRYGGLNVPDGIDFVANIRNQYSGLIISVNAQRVYQP